MNKTRIDQINHNNVNNVRGSRITSDAFGSFDDVCCSKCHGKLFEPVIRIKRIPALLSPTKKQEYSPKVLHRCIRCDHVIDFADSSTWTPSNPAHPLVEKPIPVPPDFPVKYK